jgi:hypothetical protein
VIAIFRGAGANLFQAAFERVAGANVRADGQKFRRQSGVEPPHSKKMGLILRQSATAR